MARLHVSALAVAAGLVARVAASAHIVARETPAPRLAARQAAVPDVSAISQCEVVASTQYCTGDNTEFRVVATPTTGDLPSSYTGCHAHATDLYCFYEGGAEVQVVLASATVAPETQASTTEAAPTVLTSCHPHDAAVYCMHGTTEYSMDTTATATQDIPAQFTDCHSHGTELFCVDEAGADVQAVAEGQEASADESASGDPQGENCHFHAGVEHCVGAGESESGGTRSCERVDRDYDIPLRVGLLFVVLVTSAIGVFGPIFLMRVLPSKLHVIFLIIKQFGTGVIISTAFVHLYTHAQLMFANPCLGSLGFEGTTSSIVMAGIFLSFLVEYIGQRIIKRKLAGGPDAKSWFRPETVSIMVLEAGILFHSILIGITLVVTGDSFFRTLFIVIIFHQMFEGLALGSRIAALGTVVSVHAASGHGHGHGHGHGSTQVAQTKSASDTDPAITPSADASDNSTTDSLKPAHYSLKKKCLLASAFALITPLGMAIGIAVLDFFNGNDPDTIIAIGTLDALSAGILVWVGVVEMWAEDWMYPNSELMNSSPIVTALSLFGLMAGMALMSFLGKWA
ncbi:Zinc-regulated transporter 2 like protein [Verticillium longisporum]|uniref:Zinc-regulated transporter 2 like protein n=1 Tax=Verticillium longisporum TaxID=100787 RepID=A0A0G4KN29_VERLO|nr:Zinc-regulated transporter 2 like protein [Verticillium longisporum]KAG7136349.1 Zinc-regulated transporter 2 like protein [Verticillium longisporum]CRK11202.1 hypothetical protein BN1708_010077 [Verticillium longisporum]